MSHPWVGKATFNENGTITFSVEVTDLIKTQGAIEITGAASQDNGAFAPISSVKNISEAYDDAPDYPGCNFVDVDATPTGDHPFAVNLEITVFVRVSKVWVTVLGLGTGAVRDAGAAAAAGQTWKFETDGQISPP